MADIESNIDINIDASSALASIKHLQAQISAFHQSMAKSGAQANAVAGQMQQQLLNSINATGKFNATMTTVATTTESFTNALEKNKLSMGQYFRYAAGATTGFGKLFRSEFDTIEKVARERVKTLQTQYIKLGRDANGAMQAIQVRPLALDMDNLATKTAIAAQKSQVFNQLLQQGSTQMLNFGKNTQWAGRQLMVGFTVPLGIFAASAGKEFAKLEEQVIRFKRVYGDTFTASAETDLMVGQIRDLANEFTKYGVAVEKTLGLAADAAAMGKQGADLIAQVSQANKLAVLGGVDQAQALETTISMTNAFGTAADQLSSKINFLNAVENQTVTSIGDLTEAMPIAAPVVQQLGGSIEDLTFFLTAMKEGGINANEGANALKSGLASLINPSAEASDMLNGLGINLEAIVQSNAGNVKGVITEFATALDQLDPLARAQAIEQLFGKFQFSRMSTLFQNVIAEGSQAQKVAQLTKATTEELAVMSEREMKKIENSPLYKFQGAIERFQASMAPVGEAFMKAVTPIIDFGTRILDNFNNMGDGAKQFITILVAAVAGLGPVLLMAFGLMANGFANIIKMFSFISNGFRGLSGDSQLLGNQTNYMSQQQLEAAAVAASLNQTHQSLIQTFSSEAGAVNNLAAAYRGAVTAQIGMRGPMAAGAPRKMATGGIVYGPGTGTSDSVPAMLSRGEAVIPASAVRANPAMVAGLIAGNIPGYAEGAFNIGEIKKQVGLYKAPSAIGAQTRQMIWESLQSELAAIKEALGATSGASQSQIDQLGRVQASHLQSDVSQVNVGGQNVDFKNWKAENLQADTGYVNNYMNALGENSKILNNFEKAHIDVAAKELGMSISEVQTELDKFKQGIHPSTANAAKVMQKVGESDPGYQGQAVSAGLKERLKGNFYDTLGLRSYDPAKDASAAKTTETRIANLKAKVADAKPEQKTRDEVIAENAAKQKEATQARNKTFQDQKNREAKVAAEEAAKRKKWAAEDRAMGVEVSGAPSKPPTPRRQSNKKPFNPNDPLSGTAAEHRSYAKQQEQNFRRMEQASADSKTVGGKLVGKAQQGLDWVKGKNPKLAAMIENKGTEMLRALDLDGSVREEQAAAMQRATDAEIRIAAAKEAEAAKLQKKSKNGQAIDASQIRIDEKKLLGEEEYANLVNERTKTKKKEEADEKKEKSRQRRGKLAAGVGMAGMVASTAVGMLSMAGGPVGEFAQAAAPAVGAISALGPILTALPLPAAIAVGAIAAVGFGLYKMNEALEKTREESRKAEQALGASSQAMKGYAEFTGKATATEAMNKKRDSQSSVYAIQTGKETFGGSYLQSDTGKEMVTQARKGLETLGRSGVVERMTSQLSTAMAAGILNKEQVNSIAMNLGEQLDDFNLTTEILVKVNDIVGPNGEKITGDPSKVAESLLGGYSKGATVPMSTLVGPNAVQGDWFGIDQTKVAQQETAAASGIIAMRTNSQLLLDNLDVEHQKRLENLKAAGDLNGVTQENINYEKQKGILVTQTSAAYKKVMDQLSGMTKMSQGGQGKARQDAIVNEVQAQTLQTFKGTAQEQTAKDTLDVIADNKNGLDAKARVTIMADVQSGTMDLTTLSAFTKMFTDKDKTAYTALAKVSMELGGPAADQFANIMTLMEKDDAMEFSIRMNDITDPTVKKEMLDTLTKVTQFGAIGVDVTFFTKEENKGALDELTKKYKDIEALTANGPVTAETVLDQKIITDPAGAAALRANADYFNSLDPYNQTIYLEAFLTVRAEIDDSEINAWIAKDRDSKNTDTYFQGPTGKMVPKKSSNTMMVALNRTQAEVDAATNAIAAEKAQQITSALPTPPPRSGGGPAPVENSGGGGGAEKAPTSMLDDLVKKLRDVRLQTLSLTDTWESSMSTLLSLFGGGKKLNVFDGLKNSIRDFNGSEDLISMIAGMPKEEYEARKNELFNFNGNGQITSFKDSLKAVQEGMRAIALGDFYDKQKAGIGQSKDQVAAVKKLVAAGMSLKEAYAAVEDAALADAVANEANAESLKKIVDAAKQATSALKELESAKALAGANQDTADMNAVVKFLEENAQYLTDAQTAAILASKDMQTAITNLRPGFDATALQEALDNATKAPGLEMRINALTIGGMEKIFQDGLSKAMEAFSAKEKAIDLKFNILKDPFTDIVNQFQNQISDLRNTPGGLDDLEADIQRIGEKETDINNKYKARFEALDKIEQANARIAAQQRSQLTLADALSQGDIAAAARAAQEMRAKDTEQAITDQRKLLTDSQNLEIENLRGTLGKTRKQLEEEIRVVKAQILEIEEQSIEPASRQLELLERQKQAEIDSLTVLGLKKADWEAIQNSIDVAKTNSISYTKAMEAARDVVGRIMTYWDEIDGREVTTIHKIIEQIVHVDEAPVAATPAPVAVEPVAADYHTEDYRNDMARRAIRGEFGNGQARRNALGDDYQWIQDRVNDMVYHWNGYATGGLVANYLAKGGFPMMPKLGTDTVPAMLTPGEFVMRKYAVDAFGASNLAAINNGTYDGGSVYNYSINIDVKSESDANDIARTVMAKIQQTESSRIRGNKF